MLLHPRCVCLVTVAMFNLCSLPVSFCALWRGRQLVFRCFRHLLLCISLRVCLGETLFNCPLASVFIHIISVAFLCVAINSKSVIKSVKNKQCEWCDKMTQTSETVGTTHCTSVKDHLQGQQHSDPPPCWPTCYWLVWDGVTGVTHQ